VIIAVAGFVIRLKALLVKKFAELTAAQNVVSFFNGNDNEDGTGEPFSALPSEVRP
jgi:hypothetical protein